MHMYLTQRPVKEQVWGWYCSKKLKNMSRCVSLSRQLAQQAVHPPAMMTFSRYMLLEPFMMDCRGMMMHKLKLAAGGSQMTSRSAGLHVS